MCEAIFTGLIRNDGKNECPAKKLTVPVPDFVNKLLFHTINCETSFNPYFASFSQPLSFLFSGKIF
jgi:hypothetical protein